MHFRASTFDSRHMAALLTRTIRAIVIPLHLCRSDHLVLSAKGARMMKTADIKAGTIEGYFALIGIANEIPRWSICHPQQKSH